MNKTLLVGGIGVVFVASVAGFTLKDKVLVKGVSMNISPTLEPTLQPTAIPTLIPTNTPIPTIKIWPTFTPTPKMQPTNIPSSPTPTIQDSQKHIDVQTNLNPNMQQIDVHASQDNSHMKTMQVQAGQ